MVLAIDNFSAEFDQALTVQDRLRIKLNQYGEKHIPVTIEELASSMKLPNNSVYQALNRLRQYGEIDLEKAEQENGREKIVGIVIKRLEPSNRTYRRVADRSGRVQRIKPSSLQMIENVETVDGIPMLPETHDYLNKKVAVEEMKQKAMGAGLDPSVIAFEPNPIAEEAVILLKLYSDLRASYKEAKDQIRQLGFDLEAEKRNVDYYKEKVKEETQKELLAHARSH